MRNVGPEDLWIGSPTTKGRENAGYGGLFWRGPRSFTNGRLRTVDGDGGDELRGTRHAWMGFTGRHDGIDEASTIVMVDDPGNIHHPPQWFARSEEFACMCPAPFFSEEVLLARGEEVDVPLRRRDRRRRGARRARSRRWPVRGSRRWPAASAAGGVPARAACPV